MSLYHSEMIELMCDYAVSAIDSIDYETRASMTREYLEDVVYDAAIDALSDYLADDTHALAVARDTYPDVDEWLGIDRLMVDYPYMLDQYMEEIIDV